jgi:hypothetical protein
VAAELTDVPCMIRRLAVRDVPGSDTPQHNLDATGISTRHITQTVRETVTRAAG